MVEPGACHRSGAGPGRCQRSFTPFVRHWKVGKVNYLDKEVGISNEGWMRFREEVVNLFECVGSDYYLKNSLRTLVPGPVIPQDPDRVWPRMVWPWVNRAIGKATSTTEGG